MTNKQLALLFGSMLFNFTVALGLLPFLPLHATTNLGVDPSQTGVFLSIVSVALTSGTVVGGWLGDKYRRRKLIMLASSVIGFPSLFLIGFATELWQLTLLAASTWLAIGMSTTMIRVITGILADETERGRIFGIIGAATPLSSIIGGALAGPIADQWGMPTLFMVMSISFVLQFVTVFFITDIPRVDDDEKAKNDAAADVGFGMAYWFLAIASLILFAALATILAARPLHMDRLGFDGTSISQIVIPGAIISLPLTYYIGSLSDRVGRKQMLFLCYLVATVGMGILIISEPLWHFWLSEVCLAFVGISTAVTAALVTDLVPRAALDKALSRIIAISWMGTIIGFAISGYIIDWLGLSTMFMVSTVIGFVALCLVIPIRNPDKRVSPIAT